MQWWLWLLLGLVLLMFEVAAPGGFFIMFFGAAAILVGALVALDLGGTASFQLLMFSVLAVVLLVLFRRRLLAMVGRGGAGGSVDSLIGEAATLLEDVAAGGLGKAELRGTAWTVRNEETRNLTRGARVRVRHVDGLTLRVGAE
jgi:hypothetical protein